MSGEPEKKMHTLKKCMPNYNNSKTPENSRKCFDTRERRENARKN